MLKPSNSLPLLLCTVQNKAGDLSVQWRLWLWLAEPPKKSEKSGHPKTVRCRTVVRSPNWEPGKKRDIAVQVGAWEISQRSSDLACALLAQA